MKIVFITVIVFFVTQQQSHAGVVRKQPAFATPFYSGSYLPAAMQVIFHAVEQLKHLEEDEKLSSTTTTTRLPPKTSPHAPVYHQPMADDQMDSMASMLYSASTSSFESSSLSASSSSSSTSNPVAEEFAQDKPVVDDGSSGATTIVDATSIDTEKSVIVGEATTKMGFEAETPETNYATPEINHEAQETVEEVTESNQETVEQDDDDGDVNFGDGGSIGERYSDESKKLNDDGDEKSLDSHSDENEDEDDEIRFTMIGEKVEQVPRPSLLMHLKKNYRAPLRGSLEELASLYDALSKDARRQGYSQYSGYTDSVLKTLQSSVEGGAGHQLRVLLEKTRERNELTRDDGKNKVAVALKQLADPGSVLSTDLRRLIPLRYIP